MELFFSDPWNCSKNPIVSMEGQEVLKNITVNKAVTAEVEVTDGELNLNITAPAATLCINLCYIKIYLPKDQVVTPTPEPTNAPVPTEVPAEPTSAPTEPTAEPTNAPANDKDADTNTSSNGKSSSALPWMAGGALVIGAIAGALTYFFKKKKK